VFALQGKDGLTVSLSVFVNAANGYTPPTDLWFHIMTSRAHTAQFDHVAANMQSPQQFSPSNPDLAIPFA
jgi:hypothetical protein